MENKYEDLSLEDLQLELSRLKKISSDFKNEEQAVKLTLNSIYGALGNQYFAFFNTEVAESVTLQGQDLIKFAEKILNKYFHEHWHLDTELHEKLGARNVRPLSGDMVIYIDTDSVLGESVIKIRDFCGFEQSVTIEELFNAYSNDGFYLDLKGNHIIDNPQFDVLNFKNGSLEFSGVRKIIRHKVSKKKWRINTKSGKSITVTDDHSIMVFRDGKKISVKPSEINPFTDKIMEIINI